MKISIIGLSGSGKTTLAKNISQKLGIPHIQLDRFWFESDGHKLTKNSPTADKEIIRAKIRKKALAATAELNWVSDGFYSRVQPEIAEQADIVIFLDIPLWQRLRNHMARIWKLDRHKELSKWDEIKFTLEIIRRHFKHGPKLKKLAHTYRNKVVKITSRKEIEGYVRQIK